MEKRIHYLDWLRLLAVFLGLVFHAGRPFDDWPWLIKGSQIGWMAFFNEALSTVRVPLLFFVSGAATVFVLKGLARNFVWERFKRLLIPLGMGVLLIVPPQSYIVRISLDPSNPQHFSGSYWQFLTGPWLQEGSFPLSNLHTEHLWYLLYLFIFSILALPIFLYLRSPQGMALLARLDRGLQQGPQRFWLIFLAPTVLAVSLPFLLPSHPGLVEDLENLSYYFFVFVLGFALYRQPGLLQTIFVLRRTFLTLGVALVLTKAFLFTQILKHELFKQAFQAPHYLLYWLIRDTAALCLILAILGYAYRYLNSPSWFLKRAKYWVYPFYIWHQTVVVVLGFFVLQLELPPGLQYAALLLGSFALTIALSELVQHSSLSRFLFGVQRKSSDKSPRSLTSRPPRALD